jgi:hypothetical protein
LVVGKGEGLLGESAAAGHATESRDDALIVLAKELGVSPEAKAEATVSEVGRALSPGTVWGEKLLWGDLFDRYAGPVHTGL